MGKLIFSQKTIAGVSGLKPNTYYRVKSLLGGTYLYEIFNASDLYAAGSDTISIWQNGDINSTPITALNNDPEWIDPVSEQNIDNTLIPVGSVIFINSSLDHSYSGAVLVKYYQGKTSIKKQNLSVSGYSIALVNGVYKLQNTLINGRNWYLHDSLLFNVRWNNSTSRWNLLSNQGVELSVATNSTDNPWEATWSNNVQVSLGFGGKLNLNN
jgi:hypothetical protein